MKSDILEILYKNYEKSIGKEIIEVKEKERISPQKGQVRLFLMTPPEYVLILKLEGDLCICVPLTSYIRLSITNIYPPLVEWRGKVFSPLPFWVYINSKLVEKYSVPIFKLNKDIDRITEYVRKARTKGIGKWREKFIKKVAGRFKDFNLSSLIYEVIKEEIIEEGFVISFPEDLKEKLIRREELLLAAKPLESFKGENWLGVVEEGKLFIYLSENIIGKRVKISLKGYVIFEGKAPVKLIIEDIPQGISYSFLEGELYVQVFPD